MYWEPENTWVIYASLVEGHFNPEGRRDDEAYQSFINAGIPEEQIFYLKDHAATGANMVDALNTVCEQADENAFLIYIYSGHGGLVEYNDKEGYTCNYCVEGNQTLTSQDVIDQMDESFGGQLVWLISDCCYSGAAAQNVKDYDGDLYIAALSSTAPFDSAWAGWILIAQLIWLMEGQIWVDEDNDGTITLTDFFNFVDKEMALVRHFKTYSFIPEGFEDFEFHSDLEIPTHPREKERVLAPRNGNNEYGRIISVNEDDGTAEVNWLDRYCDVIDTVNLDECSKIKLKELKVGTKVRVVTQDQNNEEGEIGEVEDTFYGLHLIHFEGKDSLKNEYDWLHFQKIEKA